jgi:aminoglycoside phosphotransferase (APT) family kinase protein
LAGEQSVPTDSSLDPIAILRSLGLSGPAQVVPVSGGADTALWRIDQNSRSFALRVFRPEQLAIANREVAAMEIARGGGLPVPVIHAAGVWQERPALLMDWMPGRPLLHELRARPWMAWSLGIALGRTQAAMHAIPVPPERLDRSSSWIDWATPDANLRRLLLRHAADKTALLHLDLHPMNVLAEGRRLTAVLDWANARPGDPRADLARTASILRFAPLPTGVPAPLARATRRALEAGWRGGYREAAGRVCGMAPFYAWSAVVMVEDLSPRLGRQDLPWLTPALLDDVRAWGAAWRDRAELANERGVYVSVPRTREPS